MLSRFSLLLVVLGTLISSRAVSAWEIHLHSSCDCSGPLVTLGDLASVRSTQQGEAQRLSAMELFPAPPQGQPLTIRRGDLRDLLALRSVDLIECQITGAQTTIVRSLSAGNEAESPVRQLDSAAPPSHETTAHRSVQQHREPGERSDMMPTDDAYVVVTSRLIQRGDIIRSEDVELVLSDAPSRRDGLHSTLDEVIGHEATQTIAAHRVIERRTIRRPLMVRRNDLVTVIARGGGVRIRTNARVMEDGSEGDLVRMQSPDRQKEYLARVVGIQEVEVYVAAATLPRNEQR